MCRKAAKVCVGNSLICLGQIRRIAGEIRAICWEFRIASLVPCSKAVLSPYQLEPVREIGVDLLWEISAGALQRTLTGARLERQ